MVPKGGLEPPRVSPLPPQDSVSANSTTSACAREKRTPVVSGRPLKTNMNPSYQSRGLRLFYCAGCPVPGAPGTVEGGATGATSAGAETAGTSLIIDSVFARPDMYVSAIEVSMNTAAHA